MRAVIFDMDGLMFDTERVFVQAWDYAGEKIGIGKAGHMVLKTLGLNTDSTRAVWQQTFGDRYDEAALMSHSKAFLTDYYAKHKVPVKKGLYSLLAYLKEAGYRMAVASSTPSATVERHLADAGVREYFSAVVCGNQVARSKPEPDIYLTACERLGVTPEEAYALEDSRNGLFSAYRAGCKPIMVPDLWEADAETEAILYAKCADLEKVQKFLVDK